MCEMKQLAWWQKCPLSWKEKETKICSWKWDKEHIEAVRSKYCLTGALLKEEKHLKHKIYSLELLASCPCPPWSAARREDLPLSWKICDSLGGKFFRTQEPHQKSRESSFFFWRCLVFTGQPLAEWNWSGDVNPWTADTGQLLTLPGFSASRKNPQATEGLEDENRERPFGPNWKETCWWILTCGPSGDILRIIWSVRIVLNYRSNQRRIEQLRNIDFEEWFNASCVTAAVELLTKSSVEW